MYKWKQGKPVSHYGELWNLKLDEFDIWFKVQQVVDCGKGHGYRQVQSDNHTSSIPVEFCWIVYSRHGRMLKAQAISDPLFLGDDLKFRSREEAMRTCEQYLMNLGTIGTQVQNHRETKGLV